MLYTFRNFSGELADQRDPKTAAMLSLIPGLGQYYNGQSRKGMLFLDVAILNYILLGLILLAPQISEGLKKLGSLCSMEVNQTLVGLLHSLRLGTPASMVVLGLVLTFIAYAVRDAYDQANVKKRKAIYKDAIIELNEAASGSYILHASSIVALAVMALFFFIPHPTARQVIEIEILTNMTKTTPKVETRNQASKPSDAKRNYDRSRPLNRTAQQAELSKTVAPSESRQLASSANQAASSSARTTQSIPVPKPVLQNMIAKAFTPPAPPLQVAHSVQAGAVTPPIQALKTAQNSVQNSVQNSAPSSAVTTHVPRPMLSKSAPPMLPTPPMPTNPNSVSSVVAARLPLPLSITPNNFAPMTLNSTLPSTQSAGARVNLAQVAGSNALKGRSSNAMPSASPSSNSAAATGIQLPGLQSANTGATSAGRNIAPIMPGTSQGSRMGNPADSGPRMFDPGQIGGKSHGFGTGTQTMPVPIEGTGRGNSRETGERGNNPAPYRASGNDRAGLPNLVPQVGQGNARPNTDEGEHGLTPSLPASAPEVDYSKYMADLQRRIKRAWMPPREGQSLKVKVMFMIFRNGELGRVQLVKSSGMALADQAATKAVENAAPFAHLPAGAPPSIDVEFTFDYNVFQGAVR